MEKIIIDTIKIKNFRSITNGYITCKDMNVLVGLNDVGKSNYLKALNLFFNNQTESGRNFDFNHDFSIISDKKGHGTKEIIIELLITMPSTYKGPSKYIWKKTWRSVGLYKEEIKTINGKKISARSRVPNTLKRIKYRYVPAVKSKDYYKSLLEELYFTVSSTINSPLKSTTNNFSQEIQKYTKQISEEVENRIGIASQLTIPENLSQLFRALEFKTMISDRESISLDYRGDGIQARHIPIILKYIADKDQETRNRGSMKIYTLWGFEEPENGVELSKVFEIANEFNEYSSYFQIFVTSHSPAFYQLIDKDNINVLSVYKEKNKKGTQSELIDSTSIVDEKMGLMPLVTPYISKFKNELDRVNVLMEKSSFLDVTTIFVEGDTDIEYLKIAIKCFSPRLQKMLENKELRIYSKKGEGGCSSLCDYGLGWGYSKNKKLCILVFDNDEAGQSSYEKAKKNIDENKFCNVKSLKLEPNEEIKYLLSKNISIEYEIETLLSCDFLLGLNENLLMKKDYKEIIEASKLITKEGETAIQAIDRVVNNDKIVNTIIKYEPSNKPGCKKKISKLVAKSVKEGHTNVIAGLERTIKKIEYMILK